MKTQLPLDRFTGKIIAQTSGCWLWDGFVMPGGYGKFAISRNKNVLAHRWSYETFIGPIPDKLCIDHLCRVRSCVNPTHLEAVTIQVNLSRGESISAQCGRKTHCKYGHPFDKVNTYRVRGKYRSCRTCAKLYQRRLRQRIKQQSQNSK